MLNLPLSLLLSALPLIGGTTYSQTIQRLNHSTQPLPVPENLILEQIAGGDYDGCEGPLWVHNDEGG
ncbi:MAG: hypothetical protein AAGB46_19950, partial [Verrucomicrobiota bacterium]